MLTNRMAMALLAADAAFCLWMLSRSRKRDEEWVDAMMWRTRPGAPGE